jgi:hypothetical protein
MAEVNPVPTIRELPDDLQEQIAALLDEYDPPKRLGANVQRRTAWSTALSIASPPDVNGIGFLKNSGMTQSFTANGRKSISLSCFGLC